MDERSGASTRCAPPAAGVGPKVCAPASAGCRLDWLTTSAMSASSATPATAHGSVRDGPLPPTTPGIAPTAAPQRWQKLAASVRVAPHCAHSAPDNGDPQFEQKWPLAGVLQRGQTEDVADSELTREI